MTDPKKEPTKLDPIISEFATQEEADDYDAWFRQKVQEALDDPSASIPHEEVMREARETIERAAARGLAEREQVRFESASASTDAHDYDAWLDREIEESLNDPRPSIPHEQVARDIDEIIRTARERKQHRTE